MKQRFDLYGWRSIRLTDAERVLRSSLDIAFELHESSYVGGDYYTNSDRSPGKLRIQPNYTDDEGFLSEPDFPDYSILVYATEPVDDVVDALAQVSGLELLRSELM